MPLPLITLVIGVVIGWTLGRDALRAKIRDAQKTLNGKR